MPGGGESKEWGVTANRCRDSLWGNADVLKLDSGDGCTTQNIQRNLWTVNFKRVNFVVHES